MNIPKPSNSDSWTKCEKVDDKHLSRIPAFSASGPMFIYWDGYRHGFICSAVSFNEVFTDFQYLAEIDMKPSVGMNDTMHIYMLDSRGNGVQREYKLTGKYYRFDND